MACLNRRYPFHEDWNGKAKVVKRGLSINILTLLGMFYGIDSAHFYAEISKKN